LTTQQSEILEYHVCSMWFEGEKNELCMKNFNWELRFLFETKNRSFFNFPSHLTMFNIYAHPIDRSKFFLVSKTKLRKIISWSSHIFNTCIIAVASQSCKQQKKNDAKRKRNELICSFVSLFFFTSHDFILKTIKIIVEYICKRIFWWFMLTRGFHDFWVEIFFCCEIATAWWWGATLTKQDKNS
jgi:hypothetical protein